MTKTHAIPVLPSQPEKGLLRLVVILASLFLVSCSHTASMYDNGAVGSRKKPETAQKDREAEPQSGDIRVTDGVEYIYGKNPRYMVTPGEPFYVWMRRDQYTPGSVDSTGRPTKDLKKLEERLAKLEAELHSGGAPQPASPAQSASKPSVSDEAGRKWASYWKNDQGVESFWDEESLLRPRKGLIQIWRKRAFPSGSAQKEIAARDEINCREAQWRTLELRVTNWDGTTRTSDKATAWGNVYANSAEEYLMDQHCK